MSTINEQIADLQKRAEAYERMKATRDEVEKLLTEAKAKISQVIQIFNPVIKITSQNGNRRLGKVNVEFQDNMKSLYDLLKAGTSLSVQDIAKFLNCPDSNAYYPYAKLRHMANVQERDVRDGIKIKNIYM
jgi:hypothetical protein